MRSKRRVLVTGGAGFIGSHLVEALARRGDSVVVLDDLSTGRPSNLETALQTGDVRMVVGSVLDSALVADLVAEVDEVAHLAGVVGVKLVLRDPIAAIESIVQGTQVVLRHAARRDVPVLLTSSSEVYGPNDRPVLRETDRAVLGPPTIARWSYAAAKLTAEHLALAHHEADDLRVVVVRLFNTVGPRQDAAHGMVLPRFVRQAASGDPLTVYGDGEQTRAFADVRDVVPSLLALASNANASGRIVNLGADAPITVRALADRVRLVLDARVEVVHVPHEVAYGPRFEEVRTRLPDLAVARSLVGPLPARGLDDTIRDVAAALTREPARSGLAEPAEHRGDFGPI